MNFFLCLRCANFCFYTEDRSHTALYFNIINVVQLFRSPIPCINATSAKLAISFGRDLYSSSNYSLKDVSLLIFPNALTRHTREETDCIH